MAAPNDNLLFTPSDGTGPVQPLPPLGQLPPLPQMGQRKPAPPLDPWASLSTMVPQGPSTQLPPMPNAGGLNVQQFIQPQQDMRDMLMPYVLGQIAQKTAAPAAAAQSDLAKGDLAKAHPSPWAVEKDPSLSGAETSG